MPPPNSQGETRNKWSLPKLLRKPGLLGIGALLTWLILFHLLVNVWLLCLFTSLLVVCGGWLGFRAILDTNSLLHLEHFFPLRTLFSSQPASHSLEHEWKLDNEIRSAVAKAIRDFVSSWYRTILCEEKGEWEQEVEDATLESMMELKERFQHVDRKALLQRALELCGRHLQSYLTAREMQAEAARLQRESGSLWELYSKVIAPHPALSSTAKEVSYAQAMVNICIHALAPIPHLETRTGRYMVAELINCNVLLPLVERVSDPDWLNLTIVETFARSREQPVGEKPKKNSVEEEELSGTLYTSPTHCESWTSCHSVFSEQQDLWSKSLPDQVVGASGACLYESHHQLQGLKEDARHDSIVSLPSTSCSAGLLGTCKSDCLYQRAESDPELKTLCFESMDSEGDTDSNDGFCECTSPASLCGAAACEDDVDGGCFGPLRALGPKVEPHWPAGITEGLPFSFESSDTPAVIQNLRITGTITPKEQRTTLYTVKYEIAAESESLGGSSPVAYHTVNRRYSEFLNLQTRLEDRPDLKKAMKKSEIKGPKKLFPDLPFGNADIEKVEARKSQLDTFLKQLNNIPETACSEEMQEFLASTAFEKKPMSRIDKFDKMVVNAIDTLKTAFPRSDPSTPTDEEGESDGRSPMDSRKPRSRRTRFSSKIAPALNILDMQPKIIYSFSEDSTIFNRLTLSGLEIFIAEKERLLSWPPGTTPGETRRTMVQRGKYKNGSGAWERKARATDTAVADVALNILCLLMKDQWSWLCTENIQKTIRLLFGTFIERWLDVFVAQLTSAPCWVIYLQVMQEAVWPGGTLPAQPRPDRSSAQREDTKQQCLSCLMQLLPELITDILGSDKYRLSLETVLESLQDPHINKHLVYCVCDLLLEFLIPESCEENFQWSLLQSLSGEVERGGYQTTSQNIHSEDFVCGGTPAARQKRKRTSSVWW